MKKVGVVIGTRPEAIKMLPVIKALRLSHVMTPFVINTGQHKGMLDGIFEAFDESWDVDLGVMQHNQSLSGLAARVISEVDRTIEASNIDFLLVHGDTTSAMAASLAAFHRKIPIGHVEAGLRSNDLSQPWPEEFNRVAIDAISSVRFAPTETAANALAREYNRLAPVVITGNTGIDALLYIRGIASTRSIWPLGLECGQADERKIVVVTGHRRENYGPGFENICDALLSISARKDVIIVYPVHLNPEVRKTVMGRLSGHDNIILSDPLPYIEMVRLLDMAHVIITDSGGIQEEAPALGKPVLVTRNKTERPEAVESGIVRLVGTDMNMIVEGCCRLLDDRDYYREIAVPRFPYGDGSASCRVVESLEKILTCSI